jgi:hypothetical protein
MGAHRKAGQVSRIGASIGVLLLLVCISLFAPAPSVLGLPMSQST